MSNPHPPTLPLRRQPAKWQHLPTKAIRVPEVFLEEIAAFALSLDNSGSNSLKSEPVSSLKITPPQSPPLWLGIKPSISQLGWAVLEGDSSGLQPRLLDYGTIETDSKEPLPRRLAEIEGDLSALLEEYQPDRLALETPFLNTEYPSGRKLLQVLGVANAVIYRLTQQLPTTIYTASWKSHLDSPSSDREDIAAIIESLFNLDQLTLNASVDAIAIAYAGWCGVGS